MKVIRGIFADITVNNTRPRSAYSTTHLHTCNDKAFNPCHLFILSDVTLILYTEKPPLVDNSIMDTSLLQTHKAVPPLSLIGRFSCICIYIYCMSYLQSRPLDQALVGSKLSTILKEKFTHLTPSLHIWTHQISANLLFQIKCFEGGNNCKCTFKMILEVLLLIWRENTCWRQTEDKPIKQQALLLVRRTLINTWIYNTTNKAMQINQLCSLKQHESQQLSLIAKSITP